MNDICQIFDFRGQFSRIKGGFQGCKITPHRGPCPTSRLVIISITTLVMGSQPLPALMTTAIQPTASLGSTTIEAPLAERRFSWKAGAAPIQNVEEEREALLVSTRIPATRRNATHVSWQPHVRPSISLKVCSYTRDISFVSSIHISYRANRRTELESTDYESQIVGIGHSCAHAADHPPRKCTAIFLPRGPALFECLSVANPKRALDRWGRLLHAAGQIGQIFQALGLVTFLTESHIRSKCMRSEVGPRIMVDDNLHSIPFYYRSRLFSATR